MIIVFGSISIDMPVSVTRPSENSEPAKAGFHKITPGGKGANQAVAAARSGAEVSLIGKIGEDGFATDILTSLRREGITTSGIEHGEKPTGVNLSIHMPDTEPQHFYVAGANEEATSSQIAEEMFNEESFVLLQTEIRPEENSQILAKAKEAGATTIMNLSPSIDLSQKALDNLDYLVVNQGEARALAEKIGLAVDNEALKMAKGLSKQGNLNCIITIGPQGCVGYTPGGEGWTVEALNVGEIVDRSGAQDSYCGTLAASLQAGMDLPTAMKRASIASSLTCTREGYQAAFPTRDEIEENMGKLKDPKQATA